MLFLTLFLGVLVSSLENKALHPGPIGISLCKQMCFTASHCEMFTYVPSRLACYFGNLTNFPGEDFLMGHLKTTIRGIGSIKNCPTGSKIVVNRRKKLICLRDNSNVTLTSDKEFNVQEEPREYKNLNGSKKVFKYYNLSKTYVDAKNYCIQDGGKLAQFKKGFNWNLLKDVFVPGRFDFFWTDLFYNKKVKQFLWGDGEELKDWNPWAVYEPSRGRGLWEENCVSVSFKYEFRDMGCSQKHNFICEFDI